jgi:monoamine oxidase
MWRYLQLSEAEREARLVQTSGNEAFVESQRSVLHEVSLTRDVERANTAREHERVARQQAEAEAQRLRDKQQADIDAQRHRERAAQQAKEAEERQRLLDEERDKKRQQAVIDQVCRVRCDCATSSSSARRRLHSMPSARGSASRRQQQS